MMYKLFSFSFVFLTPIFAYILVTFFKLKRFGILFTDIAFPIFAFEIGLVGNKFLGSSIFFYYLICLSLLAIILTVTFLRRDHSFFLPPFWEIFLALWFYFDFSLLHYGTDFNFYDYIKNASQLS